MQVTDETQASTTEPVTRPRPAVERWLALSGALPLPVFLALHLGREAVLAGASDVAELVRPAPSVLSTITMVCLVWLPLLLHAALGLWFLVTGRKLTLLTFDPPAFLRDLSRLASVPALGFVLYHAQEYAVPAWFGQVDPRDAGFRLVAALSSTRSGFPVLAGGYLLGLLATLVHAGIGVHRALLAEGVLHTSARRHGSARFCAAAALVLFSIGASAVIRAAGGSLLK